MESSGLRNPVGVRPDLNRAARGTILNRAAVVVKPQNARLARGIQNGAFAARELVVLPEAAAWIRNVCEGILFVLNTA